MSKLLSKNQPKHPFAKLSEVIIQSLNADAFNVIDNSLIHISSIVGNAIAKVKLS